MESLSGVFCDLTFSPSLLALCRRQFSLSWNPILHWFQEWQVNNDSFKAKFQPHWKSTVHPGINGSLISPLVVCWCVTLFCVWDALDQTLEPEIASTFIIPLQHNSCRIHLFAWHLEPPGICYFPSASLTVSHCLLREHAVFYKSLAFIQFYCIILLNLWRIWAPCSVQHYKA